MSAVDKSEYRLKESIKMTDGAINLKCANCGSDLEITEDIDRFACAYCGSQQIVERKGGVVVSKTITDTIKKIQIGTDKTAAELALVRLKKDLATIENEWELIDIQLTKESAYEREKSKKSILICIAFLIGGVLSIMSCSGIPGIGVDFGCVVTFCSLIGLILSISISLNNNRQRKTKRLEAWNAYSERIEELKQKIQKKMTVVEQ